MAILALFISVIIAIFVRILKVQIHFGDIHLFPFTIDNLSFSQGTNSNKRVYFSSNRVQVQFHIPRLHNPRWATFTASKCEYKDAGCHVSLAELRATCWVFPHLLRFTGGSLVSVDLDDFRLRVYTSRDTPGWVEALRRNLISTFLMGEYLRLDDLSTKVLFTTIAGAPSYDAPVEKPGYVRGEEQDEVRVSLAASNWHIRGWNSRMYLFGKLDAQLRRNWVEDRGSFVLIAEECRWMRVKLEGERRKHSFIWQLLLAMFYFPSNIVGILRDPTSAIDIFSPRTDVTFDNFRLRDSELLKHLGTTIITTYDDHKREGTLRDFTIDFIADTIINMGS
ncbi:hypothetical protein HGRIS_008576 [Hohenbuehelia grisea]|uniref:Uncharacterized protein n=1 Tax=Hohenbuehelia grisea TaxID=104357 RepID=A0ABR3J8K1_9AGAR